MTAAPRALAAWRELNERQQATLRLVYDAGQRAELGPAVPGAEQAANADHLVGHMSGGALLRRLHPDRLTAAAEVS